MPATARAPAATDGVRAAASGASTCFHCGLPNPPGRRWQAEVKGAERAFCCAGCLAVAQTIHAAGLDGFYAARTAALARPDERAHDDEWVRHDASAAAIGQVAQTLDRNRDLVRMLLREAPTVDPAMEARLAELNDGFVDIAQRFMDHAVERGFARPCRTRIVAQAIVGSHQVEQWLRLQDVPPVAPPPLTLADPRLTVPPVRPNLQRYDALLLAADQEVTDGDPDT